MAVVLDGSGLTIDSPRTGKKTRVSTLNPDERKEGSGRAPGPGDDGIVFWFLPLDLPVLEAATGAAVEDEGAALLVRTSMRAEFRSLFGDAKLSSSGEGSGSIAVGTWNLDDVVGLDGGYVAIQRQSKAWFSADGTLWEKVTLPFKASTSTNGQPLTAY